MTQLKDVKIPPNKWVQIGGDVDVTNSLILGKYDPNFKEIHVIEIGEYDGGNKYHGQESVFNIDDLKVKTIEQYGLDAKSMKNHGLELIAEEELTTQGGDPINCDGQADYKNNFSSFKKALQCAIGDQKFTAWKNKELSIDDF
ncbi:MAG: hypothetical protein WC934_06410 [Acidithiobacillus sp.]|jgi:hypothetical protein|uniref:hypothetical protein n=1 Tax=Acidithiobacillus sp. TaxID=1872118 RepID=UPI00355D5667